MARTFLSVLCRLPVALLGGAVVMACFAQPRPVEDIFDVPFLSDEYCSFREQTGCFDGNPCTRDECVEGDRCIREADDTLVPDDGQECTIDLCTDGVAAHEPAPAGTPCGANGALQCDGNGACAGCEGDASLCGAATSCLSWACPGDTCAPEPAPAGQPLPLPEQIEGDCGVRQCDGEGGFETIVFDDPPVDSSNPCIEVDCFSGQKRPRQAGTVCGHGCGLAEAIRGRESVYVCDAQGACNPGAFSYCDIGYTCWEGGCQTACTPETEDTVCVYGAACVDGRCVAPEGDAAICQASCGVFSALGCPEDFSGPSCEEKCLAIVDGSPPGCVGLAEAVLACLDAATASIQTCAEHRTACAAEYELYIECKGEDVPDGPGCSLLPCDAGFDGCSCAASCDDTLVADHCAPGPDGSFVCTCAKDGVTVATCEGAAGCGILEGCCKSVL